MMAPLGRCQLLHRRKLVRGRGGRDAAMSQSSWGLCLECNRGRSTLQCGSWRYYIRLPLSQVR